MPIQRAIQNELLPENSITTAIQTTSEHHKTPLQAITKHLENNSPKIASKELDS
jgi:hypothetical protein